MLAATIGLSFDGSTFNVNSGSNPPDTDGAVGLNHYVELINGRYSAYDKSNGTRVQTSSLDQFWLDAGVAAVASTFDPRVIFDHASQRWFAAAVDNRETAASNILVAVSNNVDPTFGWTGFSIDADPVDNRWADFPTFGLDAVGVYFATNMFDIPMVGADNDTRTSLFSIPKADLLGGASTIANLSASRDLNQGTVGFTAHPVIDYGSDDGRAPFLATDDGTDEFHVTNVTGAGATGATFGATIDFNVAGFGDPPDADQPGPKQNLNTGDSRLSSAAFEIGNFLWTAYSINVGGRSAIRWHQIDETTNGVLQTGTISDGSLAFYYPSIAANQLGDVVIGFSGSSSTQFVSGYAAVGQSVGGITTFSAPIVTAAGMDDFLGLDAAMPPRNRWGDYSATSLDPADPHSFWTIQEYASAADVWTTRITQIVVSIDADAFEPNDTIATATVLGSVPAVTIPDLTIHDANDEDFFKITAHSTGKLVVRALFDDNVGNLDMQVLDGSGDVIATASSTDDDEELVVPVVSQQMYFVRVFGSNDAVNNYSLEVENFPAPAPTGVHLDPASDTGLLNNDGVTGDSTPTLFIQTDVLEFVDVNQNGVVDATEIDVLTAAEAEAGTTPGVAVEVTLVNTTEGTSTTLFADPLIAAIPEVYVLTPATPLAPGTYLISARLKIFDGQAAVGGAPTPAMGRSTASPPLWITIDLAAADTLGPQVTGVTVNDLTAAQYDVFDPKPTTTGFTPLVRSLRIAVQDLPNRIDAPGIDQDFLDAALNAALAMAPGNYQLVGDHVGIVAIQSITVTNVPATDANPAMATIDLTFLAPLPDDRYTLTVRDNLVDLAGNKLDGESNAAEPQENPLFPSGDGVPDGDFVARFTVDSRPEIATYVAQQITVDINGNFVWDPGTVPVGGDATNVDLAFTMQVQSAVGVAPGGFGVHDLAFAGRFFLPTTEVPTPVRPFDQLAIFGNALGGFRWLIELNSNGVVETGEVFTTQPLLANFNVAGAIPVAGDFDGNAANGDEIGLYNAGKWALDANRSFDVDANEVITTGLLGHPIVGDFDGDGLDDLAVFNNNVFSFDLSVPNGFAGADATLVWGFPGVLDRPVAADMDGDGIDDVGLWVPRASAQNPTAVAEWYFLLSNDFEAPGVPAAHVAGTIARLNHPFTPAPFGFDRYAEFGNELALPLVGNFDPPIAAGSPQTDAGQGDNDNDGDVDGADFLAWQRGPVTAAGLSQWRENFGAQPANASAATAESSLTAASPGIADGGDLSMFNQLNVVVLPLPRRATKAEAARRAAPADAILDAVFARSSWLPASAARGNDGRAATPYGDETASIGREFEGGVASDLSDEAWDEALSVAL